MESTIYVYACTHKDDSHPAIIKWTDSVGVESLDLFDLFDPAVIHGVTSSDLRMTFNIKTHFLCFLTNRFDTCFILTAKNWF